ncbi:MAG TPA: glycosyltransferase family 39 protein [Candidatus Paceibacterota bacterium]
MPKKTSPRAILLVIIGAAILVRLAIFGYLWVQAEPTYFILGDSNGYLRIANNLALGNGFSQFTDPPYLPDSMRVPILPTILAASIYAFDSYVPLILLQILLSGVLIALTYLLARQVRASDRLSLIAAFLMAFEPYSVYISTSVVTETIFATLLIFGAYMALRFINNPQATFMVAASALFGLAALTRPIGEFLPIILILVVCMRMRFREYPKYLALAVIPFLIVIGPWLMRNHATFGVAALSSGGLQNAFSDLGGAIIGVRDHIPTPVAKQQIEEDYVRRHGIEMATLQTDLSNGSPMFREAIGIIVSNPVPTLKVLTSISITFFTHDAWTYYLQRWNILPRYTTLFSPSYTLMTEGPVVAIRQSIEHAGLTLPTAILGRLFWLAISVLFFVGIASLYLAGGVSRVQALFLLSLVLYLLALSASVGFGINGRFRYPVNALFFTGAAIGGSLMVIWIKRVIKRISR